MVPLAASVSSERRRSTPLSFAPADAPIHIVVSAAAVPEVGVPLLKASVPVLHDVGTEASRAEKSVAGLWTATYRRCHWIGQRSKVNSIALRAVLMAASQNSLRFRCRTRSHLQSAARAPGAAPPC